MGSYVYRVTAQRVTLSNGLEANVALYAYKPTYSWDSRRWNSKWDFSSGCPASRKMTREGRLTGRFVIGHKNDKTGVVELEPGSKAYAFSGGTFNDDAFFSRERKVVGFLPGATVEAAISETTAAVNAAIAETATRLEAAAAPAYTPFDWE